MASHLDSGEKAYGLLIPVVCLHDGIGCAGAVTFERRSDNMTNLTSEEFERVLTIVSKPQHRAFLMLSYFHGMRRGELLRLTPEDFISRHIRIHRLKRRKVFVQVQPLHPRELESVERYLTSVEPGRRLFDWSPSVASNLVRQYLTDAGIYTFPYQKSLHSLRHSCGRAIYKACKDIVVVADYLGHGSVESSRVYIHSDVNEVHEIAKGAL